MVVYYVILLPVDGIARFHCFGLENQLIRNSTYNLQSRQPRFIIYSIKTNVKNLMSNIPDGFLFMTKRNKI